MRGRRGRATVTGTVEVPGARDSEALIHRTGTRDPEKDTSMSTPSASLPTTQPGTVPVPVVSLRGLLPYWIFAGIVCMLAIYFVGAEEGATAMISGSGVHELVHDARHLLGFPCH